MRELQIERNSLRDPLLFSGFNFLMDSPTSYKVSEVTLSKNGNVRGVGFSLVFVENNIILFLKKIN